MSDLALITSGVMLLIAGACTFGAALAPRWRRAFRRAGLSLALVEFVAATFGMVFFGILRGHLSERGFTMLLVDGVASWMIVEYLSSEYTETSEMEESRVDQLTDSR